MTPPRLVCFVNGIYSPSIGGGDIYFAHVVRAALDAGYRVHFFGGHALRHYLEAQGFPLNLTLTDDGMGDLGNVATMPGQFRLLRDFHRRYKGTMRQLGEVKPEDVAYAMSDYWFDAWPIIRCAARMKIMYLGMMAPTLREVITRGRADVPPTRLASLYYWATQNQSLRAFARMPNKMFTYGHPNMAPYLRSFGYRNSELAFVTNGMDVSQADAVPEQEKQYDLVWTGRVHPQKGIEDLLQAMVWLKGELPGFKALIIGKSKAQLEPRIQELGLGQAVTFSGLVSEAEKFRLLKSSRVFAMPSRYESWGIVVGEALAAGIPVVAYDLECYRPVFGEFVRYAPCFDVASFKDLLTQQITAMRQGRNYLKAMDTATLKQRLSWDRTRQSFTQLLQRAFLSGDAPEQVIA